MTKYNILKKIAPLILAAGLAGLVGCSESQESQTQAVDKREILSLAITSNKKFFYYAESNGKLNHGVSFNKIIRDLPNDAKPYIAKNVIHVPSNSTMRVSNNENFQFELKLNSNPESQ